MSQVEVDQLLAYEAGLRQRRRVTTGVLIVLGVAAVGVFVYATRDASRSIARGDVPVRDLSSLSPDERAEVEQALADQGYRVQAPGNFACPADMMAIAASQTIPAFCVETHDATNAEVAACIAAGACEQPPPEPAYPCDAVQKAPPDEPATCIDYRILDTYCAFVGRRALSLDELERSIHLLGGNAFVRCAVTP